jgi:hypothetical protein
MRRILQTTYMPQVRAAVSCDERLLPHPAWERQVVEDFKALQKVC